MFTIIIICGKIKVARSNFEHTHTGHIWPGSLISILIWQLKNRLSRSAYLYTCASRPAMRSLLYSKLDRRCLSIAHPLSSKIWTLAPLPSLTKHPYTRMQNVSTTRKMQTKLYTFITACYQFLVVNPELLSVSHVHLWYTCWPITAKRTGAPVGPWSRTS